MARKKNQVTTPPAPAAKLAKPAATQVSVLNLKGTQTYRDWLMGFHRQTHIAPTTLIRLGLAALAEKYGYEPPPEK